jgi:hypothetical protein
MTTNLPTKMSPAMEKESLHQNQLVAAWADFYKFHLLHAALESVKITRRARGDPTERLYVLFYIKYRVGATSKIGTTFTITSVEALSFGQLNTQGKVCFEYFILKITVSDGSLKTMSATPVLVVSTWPDRSCNMDGFGFPSCAQGASCAFWPSKSKCITYCI